MRITVDVPKPLLDEAMRLSQHRTKTDVIVAALDWYVRAQRLVGLKRYRGAIDIGLDLGVVRGRQ